MAHSASDNKSGKGSASKIDSKKSPEQLARPRRRLRRLGDIEAEGTDRNPETVGKSQIGADTGEGEGGETLALQHTNGDGDGDGEGDGLLMDEKAQIELDEKLAKDIHDAETKEAEARADRQKVSEALARRLSARSVARRRARSPLDDETKRFLPVLNRTSVSCNQLWEFVLDTKKTVYGVRADAKLLNFFEVFWLEREKGGTVTIDAGDDDVAAAAAAVSAVAAAATQALVAADDDVIGSIKSSFAASQTSPTSLSAAISPALRGLREQKVVPPGAPLLPASRTLMAVPSFAERHRPPTPVPRVLQLPFASSSGKRPPSMSISRLPGATLTKRPRRRIIEQYFDMDTEQDPGVAVAEQETLQEGGGEEAEVCPPTPRVEWSLTDVDDQVPTISSPSSPASRLFAKQVDRLAREEATHAALGKTASKKG